MTDAPDTQWTPELADLVWNECRECLAFVGTNNKFLKVNPAFCNLLGYTESRLKDMTWDELTVSDYVNDDRSAVQEVIDGSRSQYMMEKEYRTATGGRAKADLRVSVAKRGPEGGIAFFLSQAHPISDQPAPFYYSPSSDDEKVLFAVVVKVAKFIQRHPRASVATVAFMLGGKPLVEMVLSWWAASH